MARTILITGAGQGLGRAIARRMAADGDRLILLGRKEAPLTELTAEIGSATVQTCDVGDPETVRGAFAEIAKAHPRIDVLINNAAVYEPFNIADATDAQILSSVHTNLAGPLFVIRSALPLMGTGGHIINVSSESVEVSYPMLAMYQGSKAGLERISHALARDLEPRGIHVTIFRAGPMWEEGKETGWDPQAEMRFGKACIERGINPRERPISHVNSVAEVMRNIINTPSDVRLNLITVQGRKP